MDRLLDPLNPEQRKAVETVDGPLLVLAGAGTGKTRVVTTRIAYLLERGVHPQRLLAVTFTNTAAREMRDRVGEYVPAKIAADLTIGTFHSFCARALRAHAERMGLSRSFTIADSSDQLTAIKGTLRELHVGDTAIQPGAAQSAISLLKNKLVTHAQALDAAVDDRDELVARVYQRYEEHLRRSRSLDFDDLLLWTCRLFKEHPEVLDLFRQRFTYIMVDEYQDTNAPQYEIVAELAAEHRNLCVVGDDDQSIYGWRGADVAKILNFEHDFPGAAVVRLETNYRSTEPILAAANRVIAHNSQRHEKTLRSAVGEGKPPRVERLDDEIEEAEYVVRDIHRRLATGEVEPGDFAILYRTQQQPRPLETQLRAARLPYVLVGGMSFFDRKEVRDVLSYVRLMANPDDEAAWLRVVNRPARGVGKGAVATGLELATRHALPVPEAFERAARDGLLTPSAARGVLELRESLARFSGRDEADDLVSRIGSLLEAVQYRVEVDRTYPDEKTRSDRWSGVLEVLDLAENYLTRVKRPTVGDFLERLALAAGDDTTPADSGRRQAITLMTLHSAKGLEYPEVYLVGAEEGLLPHARSVEEDTVEEERRLMYVGITRARRRLTVSWSGSRSRYGTRSTSMMSRFLFEMTGQVPPDEWQPTTGLSSTSTRGKPGRSAATKKPAAKRKPKTAGGRAKARAAKPRASKATGPGRGASLG